MNRWIYVSLAALALGLLLIDMAPAVSTFMMAGAVAAGKAGHWGYRSCRSCAKRKGCIERDRKLPCGEYKERREKREKQISRLPDPGDRKAGRCV